MVSLSLGAAKMKFHFEVGDPVRIIDGAFAGFDTVVESVDTAKRQIRGTVSVFARSIPVDLDYYQIRKTPAKTGKG